MGNDTRERNLHKECSREWYLQCVKGMEDYAGK